MKMNALGWIAFILVIIGGLNWGLVGIFDFDLVATIFGEGSTVARIIYAIVGVAALYMLFAGFMMKPKEKAAASMPSSMPPQPPTGQPMQQSM